MKIIGERIRLLRKSLNLTQMKTAIAFGISQSSVFRYETGEAMVPPEVLLQYADYFDVSLDYIFGRTDDPHGASYETVPKVEKIYPEMDKFIEMCFDPASPMNAKLKESLRRMLEEENG